MLTSIRYRAGKRLPHVDCPESFRHCVGCFPYEHQRASQSLLQSFIWFQNSERSSLVESRRPPLPLPDTNPPALLLEKKRKKFWVAWAIGIAICCAGYRRFRMKLERPGGLDFTFKLSIRILLRLYQEHES